MYIMTPVLKTSRCILLWNIVQYTNPNKPVFPSRFLTLKNFLPFLFFFFYIKKLLVIYIYRTKQFTLIVWKKLVLVDLYVNTIIYVLYLSIYPFIYLSICLSIQVHLDGIWALSITPTEGTEPGSSSCTSRYGKGVLIAHIYQGTGQINNSINCFTKYEPIEIGIFVP